MPTNKDDLTDQGTLIMSVARLNVGDKLLWPGRSTPLEVVEPAWKDGDDSDPRKVAVEGPQGGVITLEYNSWDEVWETSTDGRVERVVVVEQANPAPITADMDEPFTTEWDDPSDPCPHCCTDALTCNVDYHCDFTESGSFGKHNDGYIMRTDSGATSRLLNAQCLECGGTVYQHPAYPLLMQEDMRPPDIKP